MLKRYRRKNRSVSLLHAHLVFCSKFRRKVFTPAVFAALRASMEATSRDLGVDIVAIEADRDHVHLMIAFPPKLALSDLVRRLKGASSRAIRTRRFPEVLRALWGKHFWSPSYFLVTCGGAPLDVVKRYVETQTAPDRHPKRHANPSRNASDRNTITKKKRQNPNGPPTPRCERLGLRAGLRFNGRANATVDLGLATAQNTGYGTDTITNIDHATGGNGHDRLTGNADANRLIGGKGNDTLTGLAGGVSDDTLTGGAGADRFVFTPDGGDDTITDFNRAQGDRIVLDRSLFATGTTLEDIVADFTANSAAGVTIATEEGTTILLEGTTTLTVADLAWA